MLKNVNQKTSGLKKKDNSQNMDETPFGISIGNGDSEDSEDSEENIQTIGEKDLWFHLNLFPVGKDAYPHFNHKRLCYAEKVFMCTQSFF